jgi:hypothetical protein
VGECVENASVCRDDDHSSTKNTARMDTFSRAMFLRLADFDQHEVAKSTSEWGGACLMENKISRRTQLHRRLDPVPSAQPVNAHEPAKAHERSRTRAHMPRAHTTRTLRAQSQTCHYTYPLLSSSHPLTKAHTIHIQTHKHTNKHTNTKLRLPQCIVSNCKSSR